MTTQDKLADALRNMVGAFDSPVRCLKFPTEFGDAACASAREALAEHDAQPALQAQQPDLTNEVIREGKTQWDRVAKILGADGDCVDSVIAAAERLAQQPGAQAVAWIGTMPNGLRYAHLVEPTAEEGYKEIVPLYTHPQPPSIPEPSEADAKAAECDRVRHLKAISAYGSAGVDERYDMAMRAALTTYTARLRERIGQAPGGDGDAS